MFEICKDINYISATKEQVRRLMLSFNKPIVAASNHSAQQAQAFMAALKDGQGFSVHICLYLTVEKAKIFYRYSDIIKNAEQCRAVEEEALQFMEGMGFIVDDSNFNSLDSSEQERLLSSLPIFTPSAKVPVETNVETSEESIEDIEEIEEIIEEFIEEVVEEQPLDEYSVKEETSAIIEEPAVLEVSSQKEERVFKKKDYKGIAVVEKAMPAKLEEKPQLGTKLLIPVEKMAEAAESEDVKKKWAPELFLSKFRIRAAAEKIKI